MILVEVIKSLVASMSGKIGQVNNPQPCCAFESCVVITQHTIRMKLLTRYDTGLAT